jgi:hypothetical protein
MFSTKNIDMRKLKCDFGKLLTVMVVARVLFCLTKHTTKFNLSRAFDQSTVNVGLSLLTGLLVFWVVVKPLSSLVSRQFSGMRLRRRSRSVSSNMYETMEEATKEGFEEQYQEQEQEDQDE